MRRAAGWTAAGALLALAGCGGNSPPSGIEPPDLFEWAQERFDAESYQASANAFLAYLVRDPLSPLVDSAQYMGAEAKLRDGKELEAAEEFDRLATGRPNSPFADDAQLGVCRSFQQAAPKVSLSQEYTRRAIDECRRLTQFFPTSPLVPEAEAMMVRAQATLARKSYEIGNYYHDRKLPESAIVYYEKALSEGPSDETLPELLARLYEAYRTVGFETEATSIRERLLTEFPDSEEADRVRADDGSTG